MLVVGLAAGFLLRPLVTRPGAPASAESASANTAATAPAGPAVTATGGLIAAAETAQAAEQGRALMDAVVGQTRHFRGSDTATVTIIEYSDFQCPFCGRFATETLPQIEDEYIASGQVRLGYQHFAFLGEESRWAAEASECANEQEAFWMYHDLLFSSQAGENQGAFSKDKLKAFAVGLGLDADAFNTCLDSGRYTSLVAGQTQAARQLGVRSTPTFLINGQPVLGAQPFDVFSQYIASALTP